MADERLSGWPVEPIPDHDQLFKRIHRKLFKPDGTIMKGAFADTEMSVDWSKYSTPLETQQREGNAAINAVVKLHVTGVRSIPGQAVEHAPDWARQNRAHSHVKGKKNAEAKRRLTDAAEVVLPITPSKHSPSSGPAAEN